MAVLSTTRFAYVGASKKPTVVIFTANSNSPSVRVCNKLMVNVVGVGCSFEGSIHDEDDEEDGDGLGFEERLW